MTTSPVEVDRRGWREIGPPPADPGVPIELSVVMPCLNEVETLPTCIRAARTALDQAGISGEIIVADNGSDDGSRELALSLGARVVAVARRGYGSAIMGGIAAARGRYVIMGDADASYDFGEIPKFVERLRAGDQIVQGCRLPSGGGRIEPKAMRFLHRVLGNPMFSRLARWWFRVPIHDVHCGLRAFDRQFWIGIGQHCTGMEFASEMLILGAIKGARFGEIPITLHVDGRTAHSSHLRTVRDGWRHLRFYLMHSPRWLFLVPGALLILLGLVGYVLAMPRMSLFGATFDVNTLLFASLGIILGFQVVVFAFLSRVFAMTTGLLPEDPRLIRLFRVFNLERGLGAGSLCALVGFVLLGIAVNDWRAVSFGPLDYGETLRLVIPGVTLATLGVQAVFSSFLLSIFGLDRR